MTTVQKPVSASVNAQYQILCKIAVPTLSEVLISEFGEAVVSREVLISEIGTGTIIVSAASPDDVRLRSVARQLRQVIARQPKAFRPFPSEPRCIAAYVIETLECGHKLEFQYLPEVEPLTAKRRLCHECTVAIPKKPSQSVGILKKERAA